MKSHQCRALLLSVVALILPYQSHATSGGTGVRWRPEISIGYPMTVNPWKLAVFKGTFERVTGWTIKRLEMIDAVKAMVALDSGETHLVVSNSLDVALGMSRRMDVKLIWWPFLVRAPSLSYNVGLYAG